MLCYALLPTWLCVRACVGMFYEWQDTGTEPLKIGKVRARQRGAVRGVVRAVTVRRGVRGSAVRGVVRAVRVLYCTVRGGVRAITLTDPRIHHYTTCFSRNF